MDLGMFASTSERGLVGYDDRLQRWVDFAFVEAIERTPRVGLTILVDRAVETLSIESVVELPIYQYHVGFIESTTYLLWRLHIRFFDSGKSIRSTTSSRCRGRH